MNFTLKNTLVLIFLIISNICNSQILKKFIEPNISISYNEKIFKFSKSYSNTLYKIETCDFKLISSSNNDVTITVKANYPVKFIPSIKTQDSIMISKLNDLKSFENESTSLIESDKVVKYINNFLCIGFTILDKSNNKKSTLITCNHITENDLTEITFLSTFSESMAKDYEKLTLFLNGFKSYSKMDIDNMEKSIKESIVINIEESLKIPRKFKFRKKSYIGILKTNSTNDSKLKEVRVINEFGSEIFTAEKNINGIVYFACKRNKQS